jgi:hypothetical protein
VVQFLHCTLHAPRPTHLTVSTEGMMILRKRASEGMGVVSMEDDQGCHLCCGQAMAMICHIIQTR